MAVLLEKRQHNMQPIETLHEAKRILKICNACRYCEGHCAVFPAMETRLEFQEKDLYYLANLCHNCGSCYHNCQYADPHEFQVNVPQTFAQLRKESYVLYTWPNFMGKILERNGLWVTLVTVMSLIIFMLLTPILIGQKTFLGIHKNGFYGVISHEIMVILFGIVGISALIILLISMIRYWRAIGLPPLWTIRIRVIKKAVWHALTVKYLDGGAGQGCTYPNETPSLWRRRFHHLTFYGFLLCFAATTTAAVYYYLFNWKGPYGWLTLPKLFGIPGGISLSIGCAGLLYLKWKADSPLIASKNTGMDIAFILLLGLTGFTGLTLMFYRYVGFVGPLLIVHLSVVMSLFLLAPYSKFIHAFYRIIALINYELESE